MAPKRQALEEANVELAEAQEKLSRIKNKIAVSARPAAGQQPPPQAAGPTTVLHYPAARGRGTRLPWGPGQVGRQLCIHGPRAGTPLVVTGGPVPCPALPGARKGRGWECQPRTWPLVSPGAQRQPEQPNVGIRKSDSRENQVPAGGRHHQQGDLAGQQVARATGRPALRSSGPCRVASGGGGAPWRRPCPSFAIRAPSSWGWSPFRAGPLCTQWPAGGPGKANAVSPESVSPASFKHFFPKRPPKAFSLLTTKRRAGLEGGGLGAARPGRLPCWPRWPVAQSPRGGLCPSR